MIFVISLSFLINKKSNSYDTILVVIDCLINIMCYKPVKTTIDIAGLVEIIINILIR